LQIRLASTNDGKSESLSCLGTIYLRVHKRRLVVARAACAAAYVKSHDGTSGSSFRLCGTRSVIPNDTQVTNFVPTRISHRAHPDLQKHQQPPLQPACSTLVSLRNASWPPRSCLPQHSASFALGTFPFVTCIATAISKGLTAYPRSDVY
jgi:hypothetical protein